MRFAYAAIIALVAAVFLPYSAAAAQISDGFNVAAAHVDAERQLVAMGINPGDATFQIGARNYAGADCPGSGWNCTTSTTVVQISTSAAKSANTVNCPGGTTTPGTCVIVQVNTTGTNDARCIEYSNNAAATQSCTITQTNTSGLNRALVTQTVFQSQADGSQQSNQDAIVNQRNVTGANESGVAQIVSQNQSKKHLGLTTNQEQEAHQRTDVCQGAVPDPCFNASAGRNLSGVAQSNLQTLRIRFKNGSAGAITQNQNADSSEGPTSLAVVRQNSTNINKTNDAGLLQFSRQTATIHNERDKDDDDHHSLTNGFTGTIQQQQGSDGLCPSTGLCGFEFQTGPGPQRAVERQDEAQKLWAPPAALPDQTQFGPVFCCATQTGNNDANVNKITQLKVQEANGTVQEGRIQGHCSSASTDGNNCTVNQRLTQQGETESNDCSGASCNPTIECFTGVDTEGTVCFTGSEATPPTPPCPPGEEECGITINRRWIPDADIGTETV